MSSEQVLKRSLLRIPERAEIETVVLRRDDGTLTVRPAAEVELEQAREERVLPPTEEVP